MGVQQSHSIASIEDHVADGVGSHDDTYLSHVGEVENEGAYVASQQLFVQRSHAFHASDHDDPARTAYIAQPVESKESLDELALDTNECATHRCRHRSAAEFESPNSSREHGTKTSHTILSMEKEGERGDENEGVI
jgi:hypothetical protein